MKSELPWLHCAAVFLSLQWDESPDTGMLCCVAACEQLADNNSHGTQVWPVALNVDVIHFWGFSFSHCSLLHSATTSERQPQKPLWMQQADSTKCFQSQKWTPNSMTYKNCFYDFQKTTTPHFTKAHYYASLQKYAHSAKYQERTRFSSELSQTFGLRWQTSICKVLRRNCF